MDTSIFLAKVMGLYLIIVSLVLCVQGKDLRAAIASLADSPGLLFFSAIMTLIVGILLVVTHSIWVFNWRGLITVFAWLVFIKGVVRIFCPTIGLHKMVILENAGARWTIGLIGLALGGFLLYHGFVVAS